MLEQIQHELSHALLAWCVGHPVRWVHYFAVQIDTPDNTAVWRDAFDTGGAAVLNIVVGLIAYVVMKRQVHRPLLRLFLLYFSAFSLLAGFGYLAFDPLFYNPSGENLGDWKAIVHMLGGGWPVRIAISALGFAGYTWNFFWLPSAVLKFGHTDASDRKATSLSLLLVPYVFTCTFHTVLAFWHPVGLGGTIAVAIKYWSAYSAFIWCAFIGGVWKDVEPPIAETSPLPSHFPTARVLPPVVAVLVVAAWMVSNAM